MILDPNDPTGLGLFSKCARNQAAKTKPHRPTTAFRQKSKPILQNEGRKKSNTHTGFEKQESRQQRERKYRRQETPAVGQYNPCARSRPKMVWDILKVYTHGNKKHETHHPVKQKREQTKEIIQAHTTQIQNQSDLTNNLNMQEGLASAAKQDFSSTQSMTKSQCMVDMSRMTGRKEQHQMSLTDWGQSNVMKSIDYVKGKLTKNIYIAKQPRDKTKRFGNMNSAVNYNYDYTLLKPRKKGLIDFSIIRGRGEKLKTQNEYSYQHYQYDSYVWSNNSKVFPNTKTHIIQFDKQTNRYKEQTNQQFLQA